MSKIIKIILLVIVLTGIGVLVLVKTNRCDFITGGFPYPDKITISKECECLGPKVVKNDLPVDGNYYSYCIGIITSQTCSAKQAGKSIPCPTDF